MKHFLMAKTSKLTYAKYNATIEGRYRTLRRAASRRSLPLLISKEEYRSLMDEASCFFCGCLINQVVGSGYYLDRINNSKGYYLNNVVVCCPKCNSLKSNNLSFEEMIFIVQALKLFRKKFIKRK